MYLERVLGCDPVADVQDACADSTEVEAESRPKLKEQRISRAEFVYRVKTGQSHVSPLFYMQYSDSWHLVANYSSAVLMFTAT